MTLTPPESQDPWRPDDLIADLARTELGDRFDHITTDPEIPMRWIATLKDGTTTDFKIGCIGCDEPSSDPPLSAGRVREQHPAP